MWPIHFHAPGSQQVLSCRDGLLCSADQPLMFCRNVRNYEDVPNHRSGLSHTLPMKNRGLEPREKGSEKQQLSANEDQAARWPMPSREDPSSFPWVTQAKEVSIKTGPDSTSPRQTRHQPPNCQHKSFHNEMLPGKPRKTFTVNSINWILNMVGVGEPGATSPPLPSPLLSHPEDKKAGPPFSDCQDLSVPQVISTGSSPRNRHHQTKSSQTHRQSC